ncbi:MAG: OmpP1/FadL family transporter [Cognatishimia sp.]
MKYTLQGAVAFGLMASTALAGGIERSNQSVSVIFEEGSLVDLSFGSVDPSVSGTGVSVTPGTPSGDMADSYIQTGLAYKTDLNENLSFALIYDQPFGANVSYPSASGYFAGGATAELNSKALTGVLKYTTDNNISVLGGLRYQTFQAEASLPFVAGYTGTSSTDASVGYLVGVAYEKPEIALRVALTYNSAITHDWTISETGPGTATSALQTETPQSLNLEFQSGIAKDTLVFGSVRWVDWSEFDITPPVYLGATTVPLVNFREDTITYTLGVGRRFNENWSGAISFMHEPKVSGFSSNLGPTNGKSGITVGATYKKDNMEITGGISHIWLGDATSTLASIDPLTAASFTDNTAVGVGLKVRFRF